jgi:hypothetical protein
MENNFVNGMWRDEDEKEKEVKGTKNLIGKTPVD